MMMMNYDGDSQLKLDSQVCLPGVTVELGEYEWAGPYEKIFHTHTTDIICMILSTRSRVLSGRYIIDEKSSECGDVGELTFSPAGTTMYQRSDGLPQRIIRCAFEAERFRAITALGNDWAPKELKACLDIRGGRASQVMLRLAEELQAPGFASSILVESCAVGVMIEVGRYLRNTRDRQELRRASLASWQLRRIDQYLNECSDHSPTIADLAKQAGVSRGHLTRLFKATTGVTVHDYVVEVRVRRAKTFLSDTDLPLKVISARLGFSRPTSFSLAFRQAVGESPRVFRQQFRTRHAGAGLKKTLTRKPRRS